MITRALGTDPDVDVDTLAVDARPGDLFLLCSDGLYSMVDAEKIVDVLARKRGDLDAAAKELISAANRRGGDDNITIVAFEIARLDEDTQRLEVPPAADDEVAADEEETLDESDHVPAIGEAPAEERRGRARTVAVVLTIVAIVVAIAVALYLLEVV